MTRPPPLRRIPRRQPRKVGRVIVTIIRWLIVKPVLVIWYCACTVFAGIGLLLILGLGPIGWIILIVMAIEEARDERHGELLKAIRGQRR
jgi:hypothetical protein